MAAFGLSGRGLNPRLFIPSRYPQAKALPAKQRLSCVTPFFGMACLEANCRFESRPITAYRKPVGMWRRVTVGIQRLANTRAAVQKTHVFRPRHASVSAARYELFSAKTPWKRVRLTRGLGTRAANRAMKSSGSKITWVVPSRQGLLRE